ncbi:glycosyltransferase [Halocola ammonii]
MNSKKRILLLGDINSIHLKKWILELSKQHELGVFSFNPVDNKSWLKEYKDAGVVIFTPEKPRKSKISYLLRFNLLTSAYRSFQPDIVHAHYASSYGFFGAQLNASNYLVSAWGSDVYDFPKRSLLHRALLKFVFRKAKVILSTSDVMVEEIQNYTNKNVRVTPFGIRVDKFTPAPVNKDKFILGTVKSLEVVYGIDHLIKAFSIFHKDFPSSECHIYGKGSQLDELRSLAQKLGVQDSVFFKGFVDHEKVANALNTFDIFCAFSREESFGVAILEASSCGLPVMVNNIGGLTEVVKNSITGQIVDAEDHELVAEKLLHLAKNKEERQTLGRNGRKFVESNYNWSNSVKIMNDIYDELSLK